MSLLEENNCEIRNVLKFELPIWDQASTLSSEEYVTIAGSKETKLDYTFGGFLGSECKYAWMSCETHLAIIDVRYSKCISSWNFSHKVTSVAPFPAQPGNVPLLLVGLDNKAVRIRDSVGYLCIYDCCTSTIFTTIQVSAGVEKVSIIHGGAEWEEFNETRSDSVLPQNTGLIFAALRNLQHVIIDINRPLWENLFYEGRSIIAKLDFTNINSSTYMTPNKNKREKSHLAFNLMTKGIEQYMNFEREEFETTPLYDESLCTVLHSSQKTGLLITGCLGRVLIWQFDGSISWISPLFDENSYVTHVSLLEPSDDPRPFYYLWVATQSDVPESSAILRMYALLFQKKHARRTSETSFYFNIESDPSLKFELELEPGERIHSLQAIERENLNSSDITLRKGEDSLLLIGTTERVLLFDLNRWYKEQMPRNIGECKNPNSIIATYKPKEDIDIKKTCLEICYIPRSLREFPTKGPSSPEELFYPYSLTFEWIELTFDSLIFWLARGVQSEILRDITMAGPILLTRPAVTYQRCLTSGLVPFDTLPQDYKINAEQCEQRELLLTLCLEQRWAHFLVKCATEWSDGSAALLYPEFIRWGVQRASELKLIADRLSIPLFDQSGINIGEAEVKTLRFCAQQLECLTTVVSKLPNVENDLEKQRRALRRISTYLQVLLWFHDVGLLPEIQEMEDESSQVSLKIPYPRLKLIKYYLDERKKKNQNSIEDDKMFIEELIQRNCQPLISQWEKEAGSDNYQQDSSYPPPSLQSLLRSYLTDCHCEDRDFSGKNDEYDQFEMNNKHIITIYLLMDLAMLLQTTYPSVDRLIKYPAAFKLSPSLIKLTQAFWFLDHNDSEAFFKLMTSQLILSSDVQDWHHKLAIDTLLRNDQHKLALVYIRVLKPPLSSLDDRGTFIGLSVGQGLVETAFHARPPSHYSQLLTKFFQACKAHGKLREVLFLSLDSEEESAFVKFLEEGGCNDTRLLYYLQRSRHTEASDVYSLDKILPTSRHSIAPKKIHPTAIKMLGAYNATLPEITKCFANSQGKTTSHIPLSMQKQSCVDSHSLAPRTYPRPMSQYRDKLQEIYSVAIQKTRETCFKTDRNTNFVPFLGAPSSTIVYCTRVNGNVPETTDAVAVTFPEKQKFRNKRPFDSMCDEKDDSTSNKKRKITNDVEMSAGDGEARSFRRLSMSQVCCTPLVERKKSIYGKNTDGVDIETPQSILKIRQMLERSSDSSGYNFRTSGSFSKRKTPKRNLAAGDSKSTRQIRFSMDRLSGSVHDSMDVDYQDDDVSCFSKNNDSESRVESFYSPEASLQSIRDQSILSDNSTKFISGPRLRPTLKRTRQSISSNDSQTPSTLSNTTIDATQEQSSIERLDDLTQSQTSIISPRKSVISQTSFYCASILNADSSVENSLFKKPAHANDSAIDNDTDSEVSDDDVHATSTIKEIRRDEKIKMIDSGVANSSPGQSRSPSNDDEELEEGELRDEEEEGEEEKADEERCRISTHFNNTEHKNECEISDDDENQAKIDSNKEFSDTCDLSQAHEISDDEEIQVHGFHQINEDEKMEEVSELPINDEYPEVFSDNENNEHSEKKSGTIDRSKKTEENAFFQSLSDSLQNVIAPTNISFLRRISSRFSFSRNYSLTENIATEKDQESDHENDYSLTKPIFLDSKGIVRIQSDENIDITDDESQDEAEQKGPVSNAEVVEDENNITLSISDGSEDEEKETNVSTATTACVTDLQNNSLEKKSRSKSPLLKNPSVEILETIPSQASLNTELKRPSFSSYKDISPRRPIRSSKSKSISPVAEKLYESLADKQKEISEKSYLLTKKDCSTDVLTKTVCISVPKIVVDMDTPREKMIENLESSQRKSVETESNDNISKKMQKRPSVTPDTESVENKNREESLSKQTSKQSPVSSQEIFEKSQTKSRATRASSKTKDTSVVSKKTRGTSVAKEINDLEQNSPSKDQNITHVDQEIIFDKEKEARVSNLVKTARATSVSMEEQVSIIRKARGTSVSKEKNKNEDTLVTEKNETDEKKISSTGRKTRTTSISKEDKNESISTNRKTRATSISKEDSNLEEKSLSSTRKTRATSLSKEDKLEEKPMTRKTRAASVVKEDEKLEEKPVTRKTRGGSIVKENSDTKIEEKPQSRKTRAASVNKEDDKLEEKSTTVKSRTASTAKEDDKVEEKPVTRKTRGLSVTKDDVNVEEKTITRKTRANSAAKDDPPEEKSKVRKTRATSISKEEESLKEKTPVAKRTRAGSVSKDDSLRKTRASSLVKDTNDIENEDDEWLQSLKRANSLPRDLIEPTRILSRTRRSTSLMKDVILEESLSQLSPAPTPTRSRRSRLLSNIDSPAVASPAANTRSRRSSIQSVPEELEEILSIPTDVRSPSKTDDSRSRRAISVDSNVLTVTGKRVTRGRLAKSTIVSEVIPEDSVVEKKSTRRKRENSVEIVEKTVEKKGKIAGRAKRGRKGSESVANDAEDRGS